MDLGNGLRFFCGSEILAVEIFFEFPLAHLERFNAVCKDVLNVDACNDAGGEPSSTDDEFEFAVDYDGLDLAFGLD